MHSMLTTRAKAIRFLVTVITVVALTCFAVVLSRAVFSAGEGSGVSIPSGDARAPKVVEEVSDLMSYPVRLSIPAIKLDAPIKPVGIAASGNMAVPVSYFDVGWYRLGPVPGGRGSAVMDGHVDNALGLAGVFKHIDELKKGDDIYVTAESGQKVKFRVTSVDSYDYKSVPTNEIFNDKSGHRLRLITCGGAWLQSDKTYDTRVVVTADLVS